jgi:hypothetical protein
MKTLTENQMWVLEQLRKKGGDFIAAATEEHWKNGEGYYLDTRTNFSQLVRRRFEKGNREATGGDE